MRAVSRYPVQGSEEAIRMTVGSGLKLCALLKKSTPLGVFSRILLGSSVWASTKRYLTWKLKATKSGRSIFQLAVSMPRNCDTESGLWPTPRAGKTTDENKDTWLKRQREGKVSTPPLTLAVKLWPTPRAGDGMTHPLRNPENIKGNGRGRLEDVVALWPTPRVCAGKGNRGGLNRSDYYRIMKRPKTGGQRGKRDREIVDAGVLNPQFVEWLQGYPIMWTDLEPSETP
jgi:hypothetical protein